MSKNAEGWIRHRGGKCPVEAGVKVDYRMRDGEIECFGRDAGGLRWSHEPDDSDIMAYRLYKPAELVVNMEALSATADAFGDSHADVMESVLSRIEGPLQWRDRIAEIDTDVKFEEDRHNANMACMAQERAELVQKLASEGFALIGRINDLLTDAAQKHEDMSDWRNWKVGDIVEYTHKSDSCFTEGFQYKIRGFRPNSSNQIDVEHDDDGDENGWKAEYFKFHSRPSA